MKVWRWSLPDSHNAEIAKVCKCVKGGFCKCVTCGVQDGDEGVALESCEFWTAFCEAQVEPGVLRPFLGRLVPVLLKNMVYDEYDEEVQDAEAAEDADQSEETDQEIKPFISR